MVLDVPPPLSASTPTSRRGEVSHYDHLVGLKQLRSRRTFELRPYISVSM